jgi:hypothetical protein
VATDDDMAGCLFVLLFENPYSTKAPKTVLGRIYSAKLAVTLWQGFAAKLKQWHCISYSQFLALKCHKEPLNAKHLNSLPNHLCISNIIIKPF